MNEAKVGDIRIQVRKAMCMHEMPQYVLRFYGNTDYALECIVLKQITFLHLEKLNDPFDPVLDYVTDFNDNYAVLLSHVHKHHSSQLKSIKERLPEQKWKETVAGWSNSASAIRAKMFVFSTCAVREESHPRDNLYMWGHYGNGHRGVAIEFSTTALAELTSVTAQNEMAYGNNAQRKRKAYNFVFTKTVITTEEESRMFKTIENILFPNGAKSQNEMNDIDIVFNSAKYCTKLITNDGGSKKQPGGILGNRKALARIGAIVLTHEEAQNEVVKAIQDRDLYAKQWASFYNKPLPECLFRRIPATPSERSDAGVEIFLDERSGRVKL